MTRRAKHIVILLDDGNRIIIQLRMTGSLVLHDCPPTRDARKYAVFISGLDDGSYLVFKDVRRLGTVSLLDENAWIAYSARLGPEPLDAGFRSTHFQKAVCKGRLAIKKALMDQRKIAGVGNIYANEALFASGVDPARPASSLNKHEARALYSATRRILRRSIKQRGTTLRDYRTGTGGKGGFQSTLKVYGRADEPCAVCDTSLVGTHEIDGRATVYCENCQA